MPKKIAFDEVSANRIANAVRKMENLQSGNVPVEAHETHQEIPSLDPEALSSDGVTPVAAGMVLVAVEDFDTAAPTPKPLVAKWGPGIPLPLELYHVLTARYVDDNPSNPLEWVSEWTRAHA
jgi:hypothetical protein